MGDQKRAFYKWREVTKEQKIIDKLARRNIELHDEMVKSFIKGWLNSGSSLRVSQFRSVLRKFKVNVEKTSIVARVMRGLMYTGNGRVLTSFQKWKSIPDLTDREQLIKGAKFESRLMFLMHIRQNQTFQPLKDIHFDALAEKKRAVLLLIKSQESGIKRSITSWRFLVKQIKEQVKCR